MSSHKKLKFKVIPFEETTQVLNNPITHESLEEYLETREDILYNIDVFCENVRSIDQTFKHFDLFEQIDYHSNDNDVIYVYSICLEHYEFQNKTNEMIEHIDYYSKKFPDNKIIFQWNHDGDYAKYGYIIEQYQNVYVINFGSTSKKHRNDILVPYWTYSTKQYKEEKTAFASFIGNPNNQLRVQLAETITNAHNNNFHYGQVYGEDYYKTLSKSIFSLCPRGMGWSSYRFYECFHLNTIPVLFADNFIYPYTDLDWADICIKIPEKYINDINMIYHILECKDYEKMLSDIDKLRYRFSLQGVQEKVYKELIQQ